MAWKLTIGGTDCTAYVHQLSRPTISLFCNERSRASFTLQNYVPAKLAEVVIYAVDGITPIFGGIILTREFSYATVGSSHALVKVECVDFGTYANWSYTNQDYTTGPTLLAVLQDLFTDNLTAYSLTLDSGNVPAITLSTFKWANQKCAEALRELSERTGCVFNWTPLKVLSFITPGGTAAPVSINTTSTGWGKLRIKDSSDPPTTKLRLTCGPSSGQYLHEETLVANGVDQFWKFSVKPTAEWGPGPWTVLIDGTSHRTLGTGAEFTWDWTTGTIHLGTYPPLTNGQTVWVHYYVDYPFDVTVPASPATPIVEMLASAESALTYPQGKEIADEAFATLQAPPREVVLESFVDGWRPGQLLTIDLPLLGFSNDTAIVSEVKIQLIESVWAYSIRAVEGDVVANSFQDRWRSLFRTGGGGSSTGVSIGGGGGSAAEASSPVHLGGSTGESLQGASYQPIVHPQIFKCKATGTYTFRFVAKTANAGTSYQVRLYDLTAAAEVAGTLAARTDTTWYEQEVVASLTADHKYRVEVRGNNATYGLFVQQATLE